MHLVFGRLCVPTGRLRCVQLLNILFLGNPEAKGVFFPDGVLGRINSPVGYNATASGLDDFPSPVAAVGQVHSNA